MENESSNDMKNVWKDQPVAPVQISLAELHEKAQRLEKRIRRRNLREYAASLLVLAIFVYYIWIFPTPMVRVGCVLVIAGVLFVVFMLQKRGAARTVPTGMSFHNCLDFHRQELERQRDLLRSVWTWYLLPFIPGMAVFLLGILLRTMKLPNAPAHARLIIVVFSLTAAFVATVFIGIGLLNQRGARQLQRNIDALNSLERES